MFCLRRLTHDMHGTLSGTRQCTRAITRLRWKLRRQQPGHTHMGSGALERGTSMPWLINKIFGKWDAVLAEPTPAHGSPYLLGLWHYARGSAFVAKRDFANAEAELKALRAAAVDPAVKDMLAAANP